MRRPGALEVCIRGQTQVLDIERAKQHGVLGLLRETETHREGFARHEILEVHMPRPRIGPFTFDVECEMPAVRYADGRKTMARKEYGGA